MRCERYIRLERPRRVDEAERVPPAKAVARDCHPGHVEGGSHVREGSVDDGIRHVRTVGRQERGGVEGGVVEIRRRGLAVE